MIVVVYCLQALIVVNSQGNLTVSSIKRYSLFCCYCCHGVNIGSLDNLLGTSAERCEPLVCLTSAHNSSFLFLEVRHLLVADIL